MRAVYIAVPGGTENLIFGDRPDPRAGDGEIVVRVRASTVNYADLRLRSGRTSTNGLPRILGLDIAGEIVEVGDGVSGLALGERVVVDNRIKCGTCEQCKAGLDEYCENQRRLGADLDGGYAQYCKVPAINARRIPGDMAFEEAACLPLAGHTAWHCLVERAQLRPWDKVLINAVGSGVGTFALRIAKRLGAWVIAAAGSDWKLEKATALGADEVLNYSSMPNFSQYVRDLTNGKGVDLVIDCIGAAMLEQNLQSITAGGRMVVTGNTSGDTAQINLLFLQTRPLTIMGSGSRSRRSFTQMMRFVESAGLRGVIHRIVDLPDVAQAHELIAGRDVFGKIVINVA